MFRICLIQQDIIWGDPQANHDRLDAMFSTLPAADLYVLPEMFSTGFATSPEAECEPEQSPSLEWMKGKAASLDAAIAGSVAVTDGQKRWNRFFFVKPDGDVTQYDKRHLFTYGGEDKTFTSGDSRVIVEWRGIRFLLEVCYDLRFPVWARNRGDYDAIIYVANWPDVRRFAWDTLIRARAIENQCFVAAVNRVGTDPACEYNGGTVLLDPYGNTVVAVPDGKEAAVCEEIDMDAFRPFFKKFPVLGAADKFELKQ